MPPSFPQPPPLPPSYKRPSEGHNYNQWKQAALNHRSSSQLLQNEEEESASAASSAVSTGHSHSQEVAEEDCHASRTRSYNNKSTSRNNEFNPSPASEPIPVTIPVSLPIPASTQSRFLPPPPHTPVPPLSVTAPLPPVASRPLPPPPPPLPPSQLPVLSQRIHAPSFQQQQQPPPPPPSIPMNQHNYAPSPSLSFVTSSSSSSASASAPIRPAIPLPNLAPPPPPMPRFAPPIQYDVNAPLPQTPQPQTQSQPKQHYPQQRLLNTPLPLPPPAYQQQHQPLQSQLPSSSSSSSTSLLNMVRPRPPPLIANTAIIPQPRYDTRSTLQGIVPPHAETRFTVDVDGVDFVETTTHHTVPITTNTTNANPRILRPSTYVMPANRNVWHATGNIPLGVLCTPLATHSQDYDSADHDDHQPYGYYEVEQLPEQDATAFNEEDPNSNNNDFNVKEWRDQHPVPVIRNTSMNWQQDDFNYYSTTTTRSSSMNLNGGHDINSSSTGSRRRPLPSPSPPPPLNSQGPDRCPSCGAYGSPFSNQQCALCGYRIPTSSSPTTTIDLSSPFSTVEYVVQGAYVTRETPVQRVFLYAVDVTSPHAREYLPLLRRAALDVHKHWHKHFCVPSQPPPQQQQHVHASQQPQQTSAHYAHAHTTPPVPPPRIGVCLYSCHGVMIRTQVQGRSPSSWVMLSDVTDQPTALLPLSEWTASMATIDDVQAWIDHGVFAHLHSDLQYAKEQLKGGNAYGLDSFDLSPTGAVLRVLADALADSGGCATVFTWRRPNFGVGKISHRCHEGKSSNVASSAGGHAKMMEDYASYTPLQRLNRFQTPGDAEAAAFYQALGADCAKNRIALTVAVHCDPSMGGTFLDLATLGELCRVTCGKLLWIPSSGDWQSTLQDELRRPLRGFGGFDAVFKLRCSAGIQVKSFLSPAGIVQENLLGSQELELGYVSSSTTIAVEFDYRVGGIPQGNKVFYIQLALLYTTILGERRVRVSTLALPVSLQVREVFRSIDFSATAALTMRRNADRLHAIPTDDNATPPRDNARASAYHECLHILTSYRTAVGSGGYDSIADQLLLPETLQLLPLFVMSLMKSPLLRPAFTMNQPFKPGLTRVATTPSVIVRPSSDERSYFHFYASQANPASAMMLVYPRIYPVVGLEPGAGDWIESPEPETRGFVSLPNSLRPSVEILKEDGIFVIDNGLKIFLWLGKAVSEHVHIQARTQPVSTWSPVAHRILWQLRAFNNVDRSYQCEVRPVDAPLFIVVPPDDGTLLKSPGEFMVLDLMIEDAVGGEKDYSEFLMRIHKSIQDNLRSKK